MTALRSSATRVARCVVSLLVFLALTGLSPAYADIIEAPLSPPPTPFTMEHLAKPIPVPILSDAQLAELIARLEAEPVRVEDGAVSRPGFDSPLDARPGFPPTSKALTSVSNTTLFPYRTVVKLVMCFDDRCYNAGVCSGSVMAPGWVMTAGHCVYSTEQRQQIRSVEIIPAKAGNQAPYGRTHGTRVFYFSQWSAQENYEYDAALIEMASGLIDSHLGWAYSSNLRDYHTTIYTAGYPAANHNGEYMYENNCAVNHALNGMLLLNCDSEGGQSGSAAWWTRNGPQESIGVLSFGTNDRQTGIIRLRPEILSGFYHYMGTCQNQCSSVGESVCESATRLKYCSWSEETYCYVWNYRECTEGACQNDRCQCIPDCDGKECGPDGCNGTCGNCGAQGMVCEPERFVCVECSTDTDCGYGKICTNNTCELSQACRESCGDRECGRVEGCPCGTCPQNLPVCNNHRCIPDPTNPDPPTDGDSDGDAPDEDLPCIGGCYIGENPYCTNANTFCVCDGRQWVPQNCGTLCRDLGGVSAGCDFNPTRSPDGCQCIGVPEDPDGDTPTDGDDPDDNPPLPADGEGGGCAHTGSFPAGFMLLLLLLAVVSRRTALQGR